MARSSDETYLESFIEHISTLPHEVRRNLDLMRDLDKSCSYVTPLLSHKMSCGDFCLFLGGAGSDCGPTIDFIND
jgi:hypothetical protein